MTTDTKPASDITSPPILCERHFCRGETGMAIGEIQLNRPNALNALTQSMLASIEHALMRWKTDPNIACVVVYSLNDRAFCAGGDIKQLYAYRDGSPPQPEPFFSQEYRVNTLIHQYPKPYIALLDGITMGGGAGISMHGDYRIGTERLRFAMPETGIGFFPDVGSGYFLNQLPHFIGRYLGLTGKVINIADAYPLGLITHCVASQDIPRVLNALRDCDFSNSKHSTRALIDTCLTRFTTSYEALLPSLLSSLPSTHPQETSCWSQRHLIEACFQHETWPQLLSSLNNAPKQTNTPTSATTSTPANAWLADCLKTLNSRSPTSLMITLAHLVRAQTLSFEANMQLEFTIAEHFLRSHDFYEGIRAQLIDKDKQPKWSPQRIEDLSEADISSYFKPIGKPLELPSPLT